MTINSINVRISVGDEGGYFYAPNYETSFELIGSKKTIEYDLDNPNTCHAFGVMYKAWCYHNMLLRLGRGKELLSFPEDLNFLCSALGTSVEYRSKDSGFISLKPFELDLNADVIFMNAGEMGSKKIRNSYVSQNVWVSERSPDVRYDLRFVS